MALQSSGAISLSEIGTEFGDSQPHSLSEFYAGGSAGVTSGGAPNVPSSGEISFSNFYGAANQVSVTVSSNATNQNVSTLFGSNFTSGIPKLLIISSGVHIGATSLSNYALQVPSGMGGTLTIQNAGTLSGAGGDGSTSTSSAGGTGGTALFIASSNVTVTNTGTIRGGGGGGGKGADGANGASETINNFFYCAGGTGGAGGNGGNGQGYDQSQSNGAGGAGGTSKAAYLAYLYPQSPGAGPSTFECNNSGVYQDGGTGGNGGNGGTYGNAGGNGGNGGSNGGPAGKYIQLSGVSYTLSNSGTLQGNAP